MSGPRFFCSTFILTTWKGILLAGEFGPDNAGVVTISPVHRPPPPSSSFLVHTSGGDTWGFGSTRSLLLPFACIHPTPTKRTSLWTLSALSMLRLLLSSP